MYIHHSVHIDQPVEACSNALAKGATAWFPKVDGKGVAKVGVHVAGVPVRKRVAVELGEPVTTSGWTEIPISWKATSFTKLFPVMTGKIALAPVDRDLTRLTVSGIYEPPLGRLGAQLDEALMHSVAEGTVKELAESIASRVKKAVEKGPL